MKSLVLLPYCPLPIDSGAKTEMWKHLDILKSMGPCRIVTARKRPVGMGWKSEHVAEFNAHGFELLFREDYNRILANQIIGYIYGLTLKGLGFNRAFGHSNPYHRYAFPQDWWWALSREVDLAVINYSYWAYLPTACPKVVVLHDLISQFSWEGSTRESKELKQAGLVIVISRDEEFLLNKRGVSQTFWSPPSVPPTHTSPSSSTVGIVGSGNHYNIEGLKWLDSAKILPSLRIRVYGKLSRFIPSNRFISLGYYSNPKLPYEECGIILIPTLEGMGVQIKAIEALSSGRAIIARKGAMRGIPQGNGAWHEVKNPEDMLERAQQLIVDETLRIEMSSRARNYYDEHLDSRNILEELRENYFQISN